MNRPIGSASSPVVTAIIVNWNHTPDTLCCLDALRRSNYPALNTVVIDNGSAEASRTALRQYLPADTTLIELPTNLGFTGGYNRGLCHAIAQGADFALLVNDDAVVEPSTVRCLVRSAQIHPESALFGPIVYTLEQPDVVLSAGGVFGPDGTALHRGLGEVDHGQFGMDNDDHDQFGADGIVDFLSGVMLLVRRTAIEAIGLLDEDFFAYWEDVEWGLRARRRGFTSRIVPQARVWHPDTRGRDQASPAVIYYLARNQLLLVKKLGLDRRVASRLVLRHIRTLTSWTLRSRWRHMRYARNALARGLWDAFRGRGGEYFEYETGP